MQSVEDFKKVENRIKELQLEIAKFEKEIAEINDRKNTELYPEHHGLSPKDNERLYYNRDIYGGNEGIDYNINMLKETLKEVQRKQHIQNRRDIAEVFGDTYPLGYKEPDEEKLEEHGDIQIAKYDRKSVIELRKERDRRCSKLERAASDGKCSQDIADMMRKKVMTEYNIVIREERGRGNTGARKENDKDKQTQSR